MVTTAAPGNTSQTLPCLPFPPATAGLHSSRREEGSALPTSSEYSSGGSQAAWGLTQLDQVVDGEQELRLLRDGLDGGGPVLLMCPRDGLGALVAGVQERAHHNVVQVPAQVREVPVACGGGAASARQPAWAPLGGPTGGSLNKRELKHASGSPLE